ncbi:MAG: DUF971 family protein [Halieaceae bacterium]
MKTNPEDVPIGIELHRQSATLELRYRNDTVHVLSAEYLRVNSPSAEVRGHGTNQAVLQTGKLLVRITGIKPVGNYAIQLVFDDGHDTGLYAWGYLKELGENRDRIWEDYLSHLRDAGATRDPDAQVIRLGN